MARTGNPTTTRSRREDPTPATTPGEAATPATPETATPATPETATPASPEAAETATPETAAPEKGAAGEGPAEDETAPENETAPEDELLQGAEATWETALPLVALMAGGSASEQDVHAALTVWRLLRDGGQAQTGPSAMRLAADAEEDGATGIDGQMVTRILDRFESAGIARSEDVKGIARWYVATARNVFVTAAAARPARAGSGGGNSGRKAVSAAVSAPARADDKAAPGELREEVDVYIHAYPDRDFGPGEIGEALGHAWGGVRSALDRLCTLGRAVQVCEKPLRYQAD